LEREGGLGKGRERQKEKKKGKKRKKRKKEKEMCQWPYALCYLSISQLANLRPLKSLMEYGTAKN
jgi:hypothetical protein